MTGTDVVTASAVPTPPEGTTPEPSSTSPVPEGASHERAGRAEILDALGQVFDPEIGIDIVSLGLVYDVEVDDAGLLNVDMTLTSPYCPMGNIIQSQAHAVCVGLTGVRDIHVNLVWTPPWDPRTMASEEAQLELGIY